MPLAHWTASAAQIKNLLHSALLALRAAVADVQSSDPTVIADSGPYRSTLVTRVAALRQAVRQWNPSETDRTVWEENQRRVGRRPMAQVWSRLQRERREETIHQLEVLTAHIDAFHGWVQHRKAGGKRTLDHWMRPPTAPLPPQSRAS